MSESGDQVNPWATALKKKSTGPPSTSPASPASPVPSRKNTPASPLNMKPPVSANSVASARDRDRERDRGDEKQSEPVDFRSRLKPSVKQEGSLSGGSPAVSRKPSGIERPPTSGSIRNAKDPEITPATPAGTPPIEAEAAPARGVIPTLGKAADAAKDAAMDVLMGGDDAISQRSGESRLPMGGGGSQADADASQEEKAPSEHPVMEESLPPVPMLSREQDLEQKLAETERELHATQERVNSLQRLQANSSLDAKVRILNEERAKLASKSKETENKLNKEIAKLKEQVKTRDRDIQSLKHAAAPARSGREEQTIKDLTRRLEAAEAAKAAALEQNAYAENQIRELRLKANAASQSAAEKDMELANAHRSLRRAQDALLNGAQVGFENEVKLHQARSALHSVLTEVSDVASPSPARDRLLNYVDSPQSPRRQAAAAQKHQQREQQQQEYQDSMKQITSNSPPRYVFTYAQRQHSASPNSNYQPSPYPPQLAGHH